MRTQHIHSAALLLALLGGTAPLRAGTDQIASSDNSSRISISAPDTAPVRAEGISQAYRTLEIGFVVPGRVTACDIEPGDVVEAGQLLASLDDRVALEERDLARLVADSTLEVEAAEAQLRMSMHERDRIADAVQRDAAGEFELLNAKLRCERDRLSLELFRQRREESQARARMAQLTLDQHHLRAPIDGFVTEVQIDSGELVERLTPVIRIVAIDRIDIEVYLPVEQALDIEAGGRCEIEFPACPEIEHIAGRVAFVSPVADAASDTRLVRVRAANPNRAPAGLRAIVAFIPGRDRINQTTDHHPPPAHQRANPDRSHSVNDQPDTNGTDQRVRVRLDESRLEEHYINTYRTSTSLEEVMLDVGTNGSRIGAGENGSPQQEVLVRFEQRLIMNYYTAKRLAIGLGRVVREYEARMGTLELDASKRLDHASDARDTAITGSISEPVTAESHEE